jgi:hypothetical protein
MYLSADDLKGHEDPGARAVAIALKGMAGLGLAE